MALELAQDLDQLPGRLGHPVVQLGEVTRSAHSRDDVLALCVRKELARGLGCARQLVAAERDARARRLALVAKDHLLDIDRSAPVLRNAVDAAVGYCPITHPRVKDCENGLLELLSRICRKVVDPLEAPRELAQRGGVKLGVEADAVLALDARDLLLEALTGNTAHDVAKHLHEAPIGVPREALISRALRQARDRRIAQPEVQHRVQHPRHRLARAGAHGEKQRILGIAEQLARAILQARERLVDLVAQTGRRGARGAHVLHAGLCADREPGWHPVRAEDAGHLGDVRALATEQLSHPA